MTDSGQINIFIIVGLIILGTILFFIFLVPHTLYEPPLAGKEKISKITDTCLKESVVDSLVVLGKQGKMDHIINTIISNTTISHTTVVRMPDGPVTIFDKVPTLADLEQQTARLAVEKFDACLEALDTLSENNERGDATVTITFTEDATIAKAHLPIRYTTNDKQTTVEDFSTRIPFVFREVYKTMETAVALFSEPMLDISALAALPGHVTITAVGNVFVVTIEDGTLLEGKPYQYRFAVKVVGK